MKVYIVGCRGNMGQRYRTILDYLGHEWAGYDAIGGAVGDFTAVEADGIIIASPTCQHVADIRTYMVLGKPILCEKPISKDVGEIERLVDDLKAQSCRLQMVSQYDYLDFPFNCNGPTFYNYFKHGSDGLWWDCINIVYHAKGEVTLREDSPIWQCQINGTRLKLQEMDEAYAQMIAWWLKDPRSDLERILEAHKKVKRLEEAYCSPY